MSKIKIFALGGLNENGKNMYIVNVDKDIFVFDAGLKYDNDIKLGIDYIIPNFDYLIKNKKNIKGIFLTHGHESNMGAIPDILEQLPNKKDTWFSNLGQGCIDTIFYSKYIRLNSYETIDANGVSDHNAVYAEFDI